MFSYLSITTLTIHLNIPSLLLPSVNYLHSLVSHMLTSSSCFSFQISQFPQFSSQCQHSQFLEFCFSGIVHHLGARFSQYAHVLETGKCWFMHGFVFASLINTILAALKPLFNVLEENFSFYFTSTRSCRFQSSY